MSTPLEPQIGRTMSRSTSFAVVLAVYLVGLGAALAAGWAVRDWHPLAVVAVADVAGTLVIFTSSVAMRNSSMYDPYWSVVPPAIAVYLCADGARSWIVLALVFAWGIRLTYNWARGWPGMHHEDWRYVDIRRRTDGSYWAASFTGIHLFPTAQVYLGCLALYPALTAGHAFGWVDVLAAVVTAGAIAIEAVADEQLHMFTRTKTAGEIMERGLWRYSRHPNYFGEALFWWGLWLFGVAAHPTDGWWTLAGPVAITVMFLVASIPMIDRRSLDRRPGYREHMRRVRAFAPWFKR